MDLQAYHEVVDGRSGTRFVTRLDDHGDGSFDLVLTNGTDTYLATGRHGGLHDRGLWEGGSRGRGASGMRPAGSTIPGRACSALPRAAGLGESSIVSVMPDKVSRVRDAFQEEAGVKQPVRYTIEVQQGQVCGAVFGKATAYALTSAGRRAVAWGDWCGSVPPVLSTHAACAAGSSSLDEFPGRQHVVSPKSPTRPHTSGSLCAGRMRSWRAA